MERLLARLARRLATRRSRRLVPTTRPRASRRARELQARASDVGRARDARPSRAGRGRAAPRRSCWTPAARWTRTAGSCSAFVLSLRRAVPRAEVFAFNTELVRLTPSLSRGRSRLTLDRLSRAVPDWSGGTRIGECLAAFRRRPPRARPAGPDRGRDPQRRARPRRPGACWSRPCAASAPRAPADLAEPARWAIRATSPRRAACAPRCPSSITSPPLTTCESLERLLPQLVV